MLITVIAAAFLSTLVSGEPDTTLSRWTPQPGQFRLYVNFDNTTGDTVPRIDILESDRSHPFVMRFVDDTLHLVIAPPGETLTERSRVDGLPASFPIVVTAGNRHCHFGFTYSNDDFALLPLDTASFVALVDIRPFPGNAVCVQLGGSGHEAGVIERVLDRVDKLASLIQLDDGYYRGFWLRVERTTIRRWKLNRTTRGELLVLQVNDPEDIEKVREILKEFGK